MTTDDNLLGNRENPCKLTPCVMQCFAGDFAQAAKLYVKLGNHIKAAECFLRENPVPWPDVALSFARAGLVRDALNASIKVRGCWK